MDKMQYDKLTPEDRKRLAEFLDDLAKKETQRQKDFDQLWGDRPDTEPLKSEARYWFFLGYDLVQQRVEQGSKG